MRITVVGTTHPIHEDASSLVAYHRDENGRDAEVQVSLQRPGDETLYVAIAGDVEQHVDERGILLLRVTTTDRPRA